LYDERGGKDHTVQFTGKEYDGDSGLYYFNARWYEADLGRFISEDPARDGGNWYVYAGNNPLRYVDPSGMFLEKVKEKVRGAIDRIKESWDRGVERQKEIRENRKHAGTGAQSGEIDQDKLAEYLTDNSPIFDAFSSGMYGVDQRSLDAIMDEVPEDLRESLRPFIEDAYEGGHAAGLSLGAALSNVSTEPIVTPKVRIPRSGAVGSEPAVNGGEGVTPNIKYLPETKANALMPKSKVFGDWNSFLGENQTNINPATGKIDPNRIFSADGSRGIRFGNHEMNSPGRLQHYHRETWTYDSKTSTWNVTNELQRYR
jgi:RHS repeat-associated protein